MKIVDVAEFYAEKGGGVRTYIHQKLAAGAREGHEIVIVAPGPKDAVEHREGGRIIWLKSPPMPLDPRYYVLYRERAVHDVLDQEEPDVVEGSSPWQGGWFAARWKGEAIRSFIFHSDPVAIYAQTFLDRVVEPAWIDRFFSFYWRYLARLAKRYDATVCSGQWLADKLGRFGIPRTEAVPFGIDKERFSPANRDEEMRQRLLRECGVSPDAKLLINVSRFHPEKRLGTILKAFERASKDREMGLVIFGDGPFRRYYGLQARGIRGVHLAGFTRDREELATAMASADAMLHGSASETYGLVIAEALCSGTPIIVPNVGGAADLADSRYAEIYRPGDAAGCAEAIGRLLDRDPEVMARGCAEARTQKVGTMADHFTGLFALYQRMLDARNTP
jgi:alpha-1,6-mannosyltransferase